MFLLFSQPNGDDFAENVVEEWLQNTFTGGRRRMRTLKQLWEEATCDEDAATVLFSLVYDLERDIMNQVPTTVKPTVFLLRFLFLHSIFCLLLISLTQSSLFW